MTENRTVTPLILAGGAGKRLWPISRREHPKHLIPVLETTPPLMDTLKRVIDHPLFDDPIIICQEDMYHTINAMIQGYPGITVVIEPMQKNTAPAAMVGSYIAGKRRSDALLLIMPADHHMTDTTSFIETVQSSLSITYHYDVMHLFGAPATSAHTGYGYIKQGNQLIGEHYCVDGFTEKPDEETAASYLESGDYFWNSGIFCTKASTLMTMMRDYAPHIAEYCHDAMIAANDRNPKRVFLSYEKYKDCPSDSLDFALIEKIKPPHLLMSPLGCGWSDIGSWKSIWELTQKDKDGNASVGNVCTLNSRNNYIRGHKRLIAAVGVDDLIVVETEDAILLINKHKIELIPDLLEEFDDEKKKALL